MNRIDNDEPKRPGISRFFIIYSIVVAIIFAGVGIIILVSPGFFPGANKSTSTIFGTLLILYGLFRFYKVYKKKKEDKDADY